MTFSTASLWFAALLRLHYRVQFFHAVRANGVRENGHGMIADVFLQRMPVVKLTDFFATGAKGNETFQNADIPAKFNDETNFNRETTNAAMIASRIISPTR